MPIAFQVLDALQMCFETLASKLRTLGRKVFIATYPIVRKRGVVRGMPYMSLPPLFQSLDDKFAVKNFAFPSEEHKDMRLLDSCNGLLLLGKRGYTNLFIWNISNESYRRISDPCLRLRSTNTEDFDSRDFMNSGFGHVSANDEYKFVIVVRGLGDLLNVHVFSLGADSWRVMTAPYSSWPDWDSAHGTFSNGAINWVIGYYHVRVSGCRNVTGFVPFIYAFDLAKEFRKMALPPILWQNEQDRNPTVVSSMVHLGGYFCILSRTCFCPMECDVWAMTEYGVPSSWVKLFRFHPKDFIHDDFTTGCLCFIMESCIMVIEYRQELFWIERLNEEKSICIRRYKPEVALPIVPRSSFYLQAIVYDETLVPVAE